MRSVAEELRRESLRAVAALTPEARVALRLGDEDAALFAAAAGISGADARARLADQRSTGRAPSVLNVPRRP